MLLPDMPKIESPYVRVLSAKKEYLVTPEVTPGYEWVFDDPSVICVEKLDGTNIAIEILDKSVVKIQNRMNVVHPWEARTSHIMEGLYESLKK
jgi:hypothetical protein